MSVLKVRGFFLPVLSYFSSAFMLSVIFVAILFLFSASLTPLGASLIRLRGSGICIVCIVLMVFTKFLIPFQKCFVGFLHVGYLLVARAVQRRLSAWRR